MAIEPLYISIDIDILQIQSALPCERSEELWLECSLKRWRADVGVGGGVGLVLVSLLLLASGW